MLELIGVGIANTFHPLGLAYMFIGIVVGMVFGIIPGLSGSVAMALLIPFTFVLPPELGVTMLVGALGASGQGGAITAVLINVPGTPNNVSTCFDGYPLARQGRGGYAISLTAWSSILGSIFGTVVLLACFPVMREITIAFGPPEWFWLAIFGLTAIASIDQRSLIKGLMMGCLGIAISFHGLNPITGGERYLFGITYLLDGINMVPVMMGLFAVAEMIKVSLAGGSIAEKGIVIKGGGLEGLVDSLKNWWLIVRASAIGVIVGAIPGIGGSVSNFLAYAHAQQTSKQPELFGKGSPEGIIASEAANNSKDGGALIPTLALGIPGSPTTAVLLVGILIHGIAPGRQLMTEGLPIVFTIIVSYMVCVVLASVISIVLAPYLAKITGAPGVLIAVPTVILCVVGAYTLKNGFGDIIVVLMFGILGYVMDRLDYPRVSLVIGLILGPLAEQSYHMSMQIAENPWLIFFTRPVSLVLILLTLAALVVPQLTTRRQVRQKAAAQA